MWTLWTTWALAGAPSAEIVSSDTIRGEVTLPVAPDLVRTRLNDPRWVATIDGGKTTVTLRSKDGDCVIADYASPSMIKTITYTVRRCPTPQGYVATLVEGNAFSDYGTAWEVAPEGEGTKLRYTLRMTSSLMVPNSWVQGTARKSVQKLMERMFEHFSSPNP